jgi:hypothetical protein
MDSPTRLQNGAALDTGLRRVGGSAGSCGPAVRRAIPQGCSIIAGHRSFPLRNISTIV